VKPASLRVLGLVVARGGSKGVPRKNVRLLAGKPLLQYTAEAAVRSERLSRVILSTEDEEIADVGRRCGLEIPFMRPAALAGDATPGFDVVYHALGWMEAHGDCYDAVCVLQPTSPLRRPHDIDACIDLLARTGADAVVSVLPVPAEYNPHWVYFRSSDGRLSLCTGEPAPIPRRQELPPAFHREGSVYVTRRDTVMRDRNLYGGYLIGYELDPRSSLNIDSLSDWERAEAVLGAMSGGGQ
jgi:CMP-N-acetylneuraminic acid synthetase